MATTVEVITSPHSTECPNVVRIIQRVASKFDNVYFYQVSTITQAGEQYAQKLAVQNTPALVIDGEVAMVGKPSKSKIEALLTARISGRA